MKRLFQAVVLSCAVWLAGAAFGGMTAEAYPIDQGVKLQINDTLVAFTETQPYIDAQSQMQVPLRPVFEMMGYKIEWQMEGPDVVVSLQDGKQKTIRMKTGSKQALLDGKAVELPSGAQLINGNVYIPLRFVSESFGFMVQWDNNNGIAIICQDGQYHAPAWYAPPREDVTNTAKAYIGTPYVWGGTTTKGFDCSGFVNYVFDRIGVSLPRTSKEMLAASGQYVYELKPGDLVFFNINKSTSHVGIYLGDLQFISATTSQGVQIDSLNSSYWGTRYVGAKRVM